MRIKFVITYIDNSIESFIIANKFKSAREIEEYIGNCTNFIYLFNKFINVNQIKSIQFEDVD